MTYGWQQRLPGREAGNPRSPPQGIDGSALWVGQEKKMLAMLAKRGESATLVEAILCARREGKKLITEWNAIPAGGQLHAQLHRPRVEADREKQMM